MNNKDDFLGLVPDMDGDGDHDLNDYLIYDDLVLSDEDAEEQIERNPNAFPDEDMEEEWIFAADPIGDGIMTWNTGSENDPDPFLCLEEEPGGDKIEDQNYQRELSKRYIAQRRRKAQNIVRAAQLGKYDPIAEKLQAAKFIAGNSCVASRYLTFREFFLLSSAVSDHFDLPFPVPAELDSVKYSFTTLFQELAENDLGQAMEIWDWCLTTFQPYLEHVDYKDTLTAGILIGSCLPDGFSDAVVDYMEKHPAFIDKLIRNGINLWHPVDEFVIIALKRSNLALAKNIFVSYLQNRNSDIHNKIMVISGLVENNRYYHNVAPLEQFREHLFPMVRELTDPRIQNKLRGWEEEMEERLQWMDDREESEEDDEDDRYAWRQSCTRQCDLDPADYETREEYDAAVAHAREQKRLEKERTFFESPDSTRRVPFCLVSIDFPNKPYYCYSPGAESVAVGDKVLVPFGASDEEKLGVVVSTGECYAGSLPCPIERIKNVIRKWKA